MQTEKNITISFSNRTVVRVVAMVVFTLASIALVKRIDHSLTLLAISMFLAIALSPAVNFIARHLKSKNRVLATSLAYLIVVALLCGFLALVVPPLVRQTVKVVRNLPQTVENFQYQDNAAARFVREHNLDEQLTSLAEKIQGNLETVAKEAVSVAGTVGSTVVGILTVFVMTFMMIVESDYWAKVFWRFQEPGKIPKRRRVLTRMYGIVTGYVNGQFLIAFIAGTFALVALLITGAIFNTSVNPVVLALIVTVIGLIPMFGNTIAAIIVVIICAFASIPMAVAMGIFFLVYQQIENVTLQPLIQAKQNELTPLLVFIAALLGIGFGGILGAFIAIPLAGCAKVWVEEYYGERLKLHQRPASE